MKIAIIGAMNEEIERYQQGMKIEREVEKAGITFYEGTFAGKSVVLCKSGVGKVNAAITTQILIDFFSVESVIFTGVAGALEPSLDIGDIVVSTDAQYHDIDASPLGFERGTIPFEKTSIFQADARLVKIAVQASEEMTEAKTVTGRILSGDQFIADRAKVEDFHKNMAGYCTEMEGTAVAHVCHHHEVPFVIVRSMSDRADGSADVNFTEFTRLACERSFSIVERMLKLL